MRIEKGRYSYSKVYEGWEVVKGLRIDWKRKGEDLRIGREIKERREKYYNLRGCLVFDYEWKYRGEEYLKGG